MNHPIECIDVRQWRLCIRAAAIFLLALCCSLQADGIFVLPPSATSIVIDGNIDVDNEWNQAVRLTNFQLVKRVGFASQQTTVWMTHDKSRLYIALRMAEDVLLHSSNLRPCFLNKIKPGDRTGKVWEDDSIEVRIQPPWAKKSGKQEQFWMIVNANGATDCIAPKGENKNWIQAGEIKTSIGDGYWNVEMAFPLSIFKCDWSTPASLEYWGINFIRFEKNLEETSSFANISGKSHLDTALYGKMSLIPENIYPAVQMTDITSADPRSTQVEYYCAKSFTGWLWSAADAINPPKKRFEWNRQAPFRKGKGTMPIQTSFGAKGPYTWFYYFITPKPVTTIFRSPAYPANSDMGPATLTFAQPSSIHALLINKRDVERNTGKFLPMLGKNTLVVNTKSTRIKLRLTSSKGCSIPLDNWFAVADEKKHPVQAAFDGEWVVVNAPAGMTPQRYEATFNHSVTHVEWQGEEQDFCINAEGTTAFFWCPSRSRVDWSSKPKNVSFTLLLPSWLQLAGAASVTLDNALLPYWQGKASLENLYKVTNEKQVTINNVTYRQYRISTDVLGVPHPWDREAITTNLRTRCLMILKASSDAAGKQGEIGYYTTVDGCAEIPQFRKAVCLPALDGKQPGKARFTFYMSQFSWQPYTEGLKAQLETLRKAGCTEVFIDNTLIPFDQEKLSSAYFFHMRNGLGSHEIDMREAYPNMPWLRGWANYANLAALNRLPEAWTYVDKQLAALRQRCPHARNLFFDYEFAPFLHYSDTSAKTLELFAREYAIAEQPLTVNVIKQKYLEQWVDFRCRELANALPKLRELAHRHNFELTLYVSPDPLYKKMYCADWKLIAEKGGVDHVYFGGNWKYPTTEQAMALAKKSGTTVSTSIHVCQTDNTGWKRGIVLRRALLSRGGGVLFWYEKGYDGAMLQEIAAVSRLVAKYEGFFQEGVYSAYALNKDMLDYDKQALPSEEVQRKLLGDVTTNRTALVVSEHQGKFLALAINDTAKPCTVTVRFTQAKGSVVDVENSQKIAEKQSCKITLQPYSYRAFTGTIK